MVSFSGVGSLPGTDYAAAVRLTLDGLGERGIGYFPELPARGPWAGLVGRGTALLAGLAAELVAGEWKLAATPGIDARRARAALRDDLDVLEETAHDLTGEFKVAVPGPWTMSAALMRPLGGRVLGDRGARTDVAQSLAEGAADLLGQLRRRLPGAALTVQVDEPALPAVLSGRVPTEGGYFRHRRVDIPEAIVAMRPFARLAEASVVHCCAPGAPLELLVERGHGAGFGAVSVDQATLAVGDWEVLAGAVEAGARLFLGCQPTSPATPLAVDELVRRVLKDVRPLELGPALADRLVLTPACGLAGARLADASRIWANLARASALVDEQLSR